MKKLFLSIVTGWLIIGLLASCAIAISPSIPIIQYYFSQEDQPPDVQLIKLIDLARSTLDIAIYSLTKPNIADSIIRAKKRGVTVRIISDAIQSHGKKQKIALDTLALAKIPIKINLHSGLMHLKMTIVDSKICTTGSFNYSTAAVKSNDEVFLIIRDDKIAKEWAKEFGKMWRDNDRFEDYK